MIPPPPKNHQNKTKHNENKQKTPNKPKPKQTTTTWQFFSYVRQTVWTQQKVWLASETGEPEKGRGKWDLHI